MKTTDADMNDRIIGTLKSNQRQLKMLTTAALALWLVAIIGSVAVIWAYLILYKPKEKQLLKDYYEASLAAKTNSARTIQGPTFRRQNPEYERDNAHMTMTYAVAMGTVATAISVTVLALGTLVTLVLVIFNRRVTLRQINISLAQISDQLKALQRSG